MFHNLHPKCANPTCAATFEWLGGGRLFRFRRNSEKHGGTDQKQRPAAYSHHVEHFWLCEECSRIYTLNYDLRGVSIRPLWPGLAAAKEKMELPVATATIPGNTD